MGPSVKGEPASLHTTLQATLGFALVMHPAHTTAMCLVSGMLQRYERNGLISGVQHSKKMSVTRSILCSGSLSQLGLLGLLRCQSALPVGDALLEEGLEVDPPLKVWGARDS